MRETPEPKQTELNAAGPGFCLTGMSIASLIGCVGILAAVLWLGILAVL